MPPATLPLPLPLPLSLSNSKPTQTLLLDSTTSSDGLALLQQITNTLPHKSEKPVFLATRTLTSSNHPRTNAFVINAHVIDAHNQTKRRGIPAGVDLLRAVGKVVGSRGIVLVECLHSLKFVFGINPAAFLRSLSALHGGISVIACAATGCGLDDEITSLVTIGDVIIELTDLRTGYAEDIDGMIRVAREGGRWIDRSARRYKITTTGFNIYT